MEDAGSRGVLWGGAQGGAFGRWRRLECVPRVGPSFYNPGLIHMLLEASPCAGSLPLGASILVRSLSLRGPSPAPALPSPVSATQQGLHNHLPDWTEFKLSILPSPQGLPNSLLSIPTGSPPGLAGQNPGLPLTPLRLNEGCRSSFPLLLPNSSLLSCQGNLHGMRIPL